ncbi:methylase [Bacillus sp. MAG717A]|uniref:methylase n=1 Tax=Bacillus sp. MAG717A TaxID=3122078 RepID=UPI0030D39D7F
MSENLIKSKRRVEKHAEVFTPRWMVEKMLDNEEIKEACVNLTATFLEPAAGEGNFLIAILRRKLGMVAKQYSKTLIQFENFSLYALSTLYGIELLGDNAQMCVLNLFDVYSEIYTEVAQKFHRKPKKNVLNSAKVIIRANIIQGDFLTRKTISNEPIIFSEWQMTNQLTSNTRTISVTRTEYSLDEVFEGKENEAGTLAQPQIIENQLDLFDSYDLDFEIGRELGAEVLRYATVKITKVYKEELEINDNK